VSGLYWQLEPNTSFPLRLRASLVSRIPGNHFHASYARGYDTLPAPWATYFECRLEIVLDIGYVRGYYQCGIGYVVGSQRFSHPLKIGKRPERIGRFRGMRPRTHEVIGKTAA
jgi:hypothetical protein